MHAAGDDESLKFVENGPRLRQESVRQHNARRAIGLAEPSTKSLRTEDGGGSTGRAGVSVSGGCRVPCQPGSPSPQVSRKDRSADHGPPAGKDTQYMDRMGAVRQMPPRLEAASTLEADESPGGCRIGIVENKRKAAESQQADHEKGSFADGDEKLVACDRPLARARGGAATTGARRDKGGAAAAQ